MEKLILYNYEQWMCTTDVHIFSMHVNTFFISILSFVFISSLFELPIPANLSIITVYLPVDHTEIFFASKLKCIGRVVLVYWNVLVSFPNTFFYRILFCKSNGLHGHVVLFHLIINSGHILAILEFQSGVHSYL